MAVGGSYKGLEGIVEAHYIMAVCPAVEIGW